MNQVICIGELLWDCFVDRRCAGGAAANVAYHAAHQGLPAHLVSAVGRDQLGDELISHLEQYGINSSGVVRSNLPTGTVQVTLNNGIPSYDICQNVAWDAIPLTDTLLQQAAQAKAIYFGSLAQRSQVSATTIATLIAATPETAIRLCDINVRLPFFDQTVLQRCLELANVVKISDEELPLILKLLGLSDSEPRIALRAILDTYQLRMIAYTCGPDGSLFLTADQAYEQIEHPVEVVDTVGAGDSFTSALICGLLRGDTLATIANEATQLAAYVVSQAGPMPPPPHC